MCFNELHSGVSKFLNSTMRYTYYVDRALYCEFQSVERSVLSGLNKTMTL